MRTNLAGIHMDDRPCGRATAGRCMTVAPSPRRCSTRCSTQAPATALFPPGPPPPSAPSSTSSTPPSAVTRTHSPSTTAPRPSPTARWPPRSRRCGRGSPPPGSAPATGSASGCRPAPTSCTWRSSPCSPRAPPTCPVDAEDPDERAELVFGEAEVRAVLGAGPTLDARAARRRPARAPQPGPDDDAWIIFTSGSTGKPKGVAVTPPQRRRLRRRRGRAVPRRRADRPRRPGARRAVRRLRRLLRGDVAGLAARRLPGARAALAGAQRRWTSARGWSSRASPSSPPCPTLAALWPAEALDERPAADLRRRGLPARAGRSGWPTEGREVWNTYGPDRGDRRRLRRAADRRGAGPDRAAAGRLGPGRRRRARGSRCAMGESGELVIGGVGLARYLDPAKDAEKYAPAARRSAGSAPTAAATWSGPSRRAWSSSAAATSRSSSAAAGSSSARSTPRCRRCPASPARPPPSAPRAAATSCSSATSSPAGRLGPARRRVERLRARAARRPRAAARRRSTTCRPAPPARWTGTRCPGRCRTLETSGPAERAVRHRGLARRAVDRVLGVAGRPAPTTTSSRSAAAASPPPSSSPRLRDPLPERGRRRHLPAPDAAHAGPARWRSPRRTTAPSPDRRAGAAPRRDRRRLLLHAAAVHRASGCAGSWRWPRSATSCTGSGLPVGADRLLVVGRGRLRCCSSARRAGSRIAAGGARLLLRGRAGPARYPRGGSVHLRLWTAERLAEFSGATTLDRRLARRATRGRSAPRSAPDVDLHSLPPVTGMLRLGKRLRRRARGGPVRALARRRPAAHRRRSRIGAGAAVGARSTLFPGARVGKRAEVAPGSAVDRARSRPASAGRACPPRKPARPSATGPRTARRAARRWRAVYGADRASCSALLPALAALPGLLVLGAVRARPTPALGEALPRARCSPCRSRRVAAVVAYALLILVAVRLLSLGLRDGPPPVAQPGRLAGVGDRAADGHGPGARCSRCTPSLFTPVWLRALGMKVGRGVEVSTVLALPAMTTVGDGAFLADDTHGRARTSWAAAGCGSAEARIGKRAFLGNSGMTAPGRTVPKRRPGRRAVGDAEEGQDGQLLARACRR